MFEELAYGANLFGTVHSRINTTVETPMPIDQLKTLLEGTEAAILDGDHQKLYQIIISVTDGVSDVAASVDAFMDLNARGSNEVVPLRLHNKT